MSEANSLPLQIVAAARACLKTPFVHQARVRGVGLDCAGLVMECANALGAHYIDYPGYPRQPFDGMLEKMLADQPCLKKISRTEMQPGDVLLMRIKTAPQHLGIYAGDGFMVHAYSQVGRVVEQRIDADWQKKITAVYRFVL
jgi:NlpC/P60 family putative phage cell wall peptidase